MKKVITLTNIFLMTILMGCSFSKNNNAESSNTNNIIINDLKKITDVESAIRYLPEDSVIIYFKDFPSKLLNTPFENGKTSIEVAVERGNLKVLKDLLHLGASPYVKNSKTHLIPSESTSAPAEVSHLFFTYLNESISKNSELLFERKYDVYLQDIYEKNYLASM